MFIEFLHHFGHKNQVHYSAILVSMQYSIWSKEMLIVEEVAERKL